MKKFEETLEKIEVPMVENDPLERELHSKLVRRYFDSTKIAYTGFRWAVGFAVFFFAIALTLIIKPQFALKAHSLTFRTSAESAVKPAIQEDLNNCLRYTSIQNPSIRDKIDPEQYREDKAFVIGKYTSQETNDAVLIVSEFNAQPTQFAYNQTF